MSAMGDSNLGLARGVSWNLTDTSVVSVIVDVPMAVGADPWIALDGHRV